MVAPDKLSQQPKQVQWEYFCDMCYYDLWTVRPTGNKDFNSQRLFHVQSKNEAKVLCTLLNQLSSKE